MLTALITAPTQPVSEPRLNYRKRTLSLVKWHRSVGGLTVGPNRPTRS